MKYWTKSPIFLSVVFMVLCSYFLYRELTERIDKTEGEVIGTITFKKRSASRRYSDNVIWEEIEQESDIYNYDAIRTQEYSSAVVSLKDGTRIELDQNTLLVVILSDKGLNINFDKGGVSAQSGSGVNVPITLKSKDATIALDKGNISVNSSDAGMNIHVNSGSAKVAAQGKELNITSAETATLKDGVAESKKGSLFPEFPEHNSNLIAFGKFRAVKLSWRSEPQGEVSVEISHSSDFKNIVKSYKSGKSSLEINLPSGDYYWRITRGNITSHPVKFSILSDRKPDLITPHMNQKISVTEGAEIVTFRWGKSEYASAYELVAARDSKLSDVVLTLMSKINIISTPKLDAGKYYWAVRNIYPSGIISDPSLSGPSVFDVEKLKFVQTKPVPLDQGPVTTAGPFNLNWKGVQGSKGYKVDLSSDQDFNNILVTKNSGNTFVKIENKLPEGKYFWRVSALSGEKVSATSITAILTLIRPVQIIALSPQPGAVLFDKPDNVKFTWRDPNNGDKYVLEVSDRSDFRNVKQSYLSSIPEADLKTPGEGDHFWRVMLKDNSGNIIARSSVNEFSIPGDLRIPVQIIPKDNEKIIPGLKKRMRFEWVKIAGANEYEIEIFQRVAGVEKPFMIYSSKLNYIELTNQSMFNTGTYSWLVRAKEVHKGMVAASKESKKFHFEVEQVMLLPAPVVKNPGVIFK
ncbi:MAG TPA: FecR family protein [Spirochaetota bacterium]|nr:FecR family protein [Spirochaetota bacterium]